MVLYSLNRSLKVRVRVNVPVNVPVQRLLFIGYWLTFPFPLMFPFPFSLSHRPNASSAEAVAGQVTVIDRDVFEVEFQTPCLVRIGGIE
jgi:hypothetical protein